jgi:isopentenyldiphosphate isomerase
MQTLDRQRLGELERIRASLEEDSVTQETLNELRSRWEAVLQPPSREREEWFELARHDGSVTDVTGPRWLFHLLGLPHRAVHVGLSTAQGLILVQRRAPWKADYPNTWDMSVSGHVGGPQWGPKPDYQSAALQEIAEELSLPSGHVAEYLVGGRLHPVCKPYVDTVRIDIRNPPIWDIEVRQVFAGTLTDAGLAAVRPAEDELLGLMLCSPRQAECILETQDTAPGLRGSLARFLKYAADPRSGMSASPKPDGPSETESGT